MLSIADKIGEENIKFDGFEVFPPRDDWGVDVDGFSVRVEFLELVLELIEYQIADEINAYDG